MSSDIEDDERHLPPPLPSERGDESTEYQLPEAPTLSPPRRKRAGFFEFCSKHRASVRHELSRDGRPPDPHVVTRRLSIMWRIAKHQEDPSSAQDPIDAPVELDATLSAAPPEHDGLEGREA